MISISILLFTDNEQTAKDCQNALDRQGYYTCQITWNSKIEDVSDHIKAVKPDVVLFDEKDLSALSKRTLSQIEASLSDIAVVIFNEAVLCDSGTTEIFTNLESYLEEDLHKAGSLGGAIHQAIHQKHLQKIVDNSELRFENYLNDGFSWFWEMGPDLRFTKISNNLKDLMGDQADAMVGMRLDEFCQGQHGGGNLKDFLLKTDSRTHFHDAEFWVKHEGGELQWFSINGHPVFDDDGEYSGYHGIGTDTTIRKHGDWEVEQGKAMLESIFNTSQDGFLVLKAIHSSAGVIADFAISRVNSKAEELLGDTSAKLLGRLIKLEVPSFVTSGLYDLAKNTVLSKEPFDVEQYFDESTMLGWYRITGVALDDGIVINISDISDSKNAQMELDRKVEELIKASEAAEMATVAKSEFLAAMSHEIRTPMTGVMGFADMLLEDNLDDASKEKIFKIKDVTRSLLKIINDILDMSKLEVGKMEVEYLDFHLPSLIKESVGLFHEKRKGKRAKNLDLNVSFADGFPDAINSDPTRFRQILINLIGNAVKFTKTGSVTVKCQLKRSNNGKEFIYVEVIDTGIGISADVIKRLFTAFTQADSSISRQYEGTGLGLSICKRLVELMGGDIGAQSELGKGSTFWFSVPFKAATSEVSQSYQDTVYQSISYRALRPLNILVAEDNEINQQIIKATLDRFGHKSHITENGIAAVKAHKQGNFDLILMDVRMPEMSGPEATQAIRQLGEDKSRIPIIAVTADAVEANIKGYFDAGMNAVVTKPIDRADLATSIDKVMGETIHRPEVSTETGSSASKDETKADDVDEEDVKSAVDDFLKQIGAT